MAQVLPDATVMPPIGGGIQTPLAAAAAAAQRRRLADETAAWFARNEVHFGVSVAGEVVQRPIPYDPLPRIVESAEWTWLERALAQRVKALDEFIRDAYGEARVLRAGLVPPALVYGSAAWFRSCRGPAAMRRGQVCIAGIDLVRVGGRWLVLEDNLRVPSGASYALASRRALADLAPEMLADQRPRGLGDYPRRLLAALQQRSSAEGLTVLLSPGPANAAYYEHCELARLMGIPVVTAADLVASHRGCWLRRESGNVPVARIYHRYSPEYLDPLGGRDDSLIGIPFLFAAWRQGKVVLSNAPTCGVADDKRLFPYVPSLIQYYLGEQPMLEQPLTIGLENLNRRREVLARFDDFVFKPVNGSGGKGIVFGPVANGEERAAVSAALDEAPQTMVAQPLLEIERLPCVAKAGELEWRRCDLRAFVVVDVDPWVMPGGLTRVASGTDQWLVNSSAGGGVKDTWVES
jgi:uncharacterized circularly permuted ATP-grasp superfamily protein